MRLEAMLVGEFFLEAVFPAGVCKDGIAGAVAVASLALRSPKQLLLLLLVLQRVSTTCLPQSPETLRTATDPA